MLRYSSKCLTSSFCKKKERIHKIKNLSASSEMSCSNEKVGPTLSNYKFYIQNSKKNECKPVPYDHYKTCQNCLQHSKCGWCSLNPVIPEMDFVLREQ